MKRFFLLGGHDLEMITIRNLLIANGERFFDADLKWNNALLSSYHSVLNNEDEIYGIELKEDCQSPAHYHRIDHHNDLPPVPSALEQVAVLLNLKLTRWLQLVAANDYGYFPAMLQLGATDQEIEAVRKADRQAQGVDEQDEKLAEISIQQNLIKYKNLLVVKSLTSRFSAISDRLYPYDNLLIYKKNELTFYGEGKKSVTQFFLKYLDIGTWYQGGGEFGYCGIAKGFYSEEKIIIFANQITNLFL